MGTDGMQVEDSKCPKAKPGAVLCPGTFPCATFYWKATELNCPSSCGQPATLVKPEADCMDNQGKIQRDEACASLRPLAGVLCPATPACVDFHWVQIGTVECPKACGQRAVTYEPGQLGYEIKCLGSTGDVYPTSKCASSPQLMSIQCPATASCIKAFWKEGRVDCPTDCGLPASVIPSQATCVTTVDGVSSKADGSKCNKLEQPVPIQCPATTPCLLPKYCPAITYTEDIERAGSSFLVSFTPTIQNVQKYHFEFIDVHISLENVNGPIMPTQSYRMVPTDFTWHYTLPNDVASKFLNLQHNGRMVYWFTYCVGSFPNNIDCDTEHKFFSL